MTRKFLYDSRTGRLRPLHDGAETPAVVRWSRPLRWLLVALVVTASALAFDAARNVARAREHVISAR